MNFDLIIKTLFPLFPRTYGKYRKIIKSPDNLITQIKRENGLKDIFISIYDKNLIIDKIIFDIDASKPSDLQKALSQAKSLYDALTSEGIPSIPIFSGKKGFHIYALFSPIKVDYFTCGDLIRNVQEYFLSKKNITMADPHLIGNSNALIRIPNTLNKSRYCIPLPNLDLSIYDILNLSLSTQPFPFSLSDRPDIREFYDPSRSPTPINNGESLNVSSNIVPENIKTFLKTLIRPCVFESITNNREPPHFCRAELVTELRSLGYKPESITKIIEKLRWADFDLNTTKKYVEKYQKYLPYSCRKLKSMGIRCLENCHWQYFWIENKVEVKT